MLALDHPGLRSPFNGKGRAQRKQLMAAYRGPVPDLRGTVLGGLSSEAASAAFVPLLETNKQSRKAA